MTTGHDRSDSLWRARVSRRSALRGSVIGVAGLAAAALIGCGDDEDEAPPTPTATQASGATPTPTASATQAAGSTPTASATQTAPSPTPTATASPTASADAPSRGGTFLVHAWSTPASLDPHRTQAHDVKGAASYVYSMLFRQIPATFEDTPNPEMAGDLVESWEFTPGRDRLSMTLVPNAEFTAPINRTVDSEDVRFSVNRFLGREGHEPAPNAGQLEFIQAVETPDARTVTFTLLPFARVLWRFADIFNMHIMPRETGRAFDPTQTMVGSGPFLWDEFKQDVNFKVARNPEWFNGPDVPYLDAVNEVALGPLAALTQFQAGGIDLLVAPTPDFVPALVGAELEGRVESRKALGFGYLAFGEPRDGSAPWADPRVRRAISLTLNRDDMIAALYNVEGLEAIGLEVSSRVGWHNILPAGYTDQSIDPRTDAKTGQWIKFDLAEAKKLLDAAGHGDGFDAPYHYTTLYGPAWTQEAEIIPQFASEIGINLHTQVDDYPSVYVPKTFRGEFDGLSFQLQVFPGLEDYLTEMYSDPEREGRNHSQVADPVIAAAVDEINGTFDADERNEKVRNIQRDLLIEPMWYVPSVAWQLDWVGLSERAGIPAAWHGNGRSGHQLYGFPWWWLKDAG